MQPNVWIWMAALGLLCNTVLTLTGGGFEIMSGSSDHVLLDMFFFMLGLIGPVLAGTILVVLGRPYLQEGKSIDRPPLFNLVVVTALCGAASAGYACILGGTISLVTLQFGGLLFFLAGLAASSYCFWRVARLHEDPEGELSPGLLAGIGGMLLMVGAPATGLFCLAGAGYAVTQG
jgi:hypothetical protein